MERVELLIIGGGVAGQSAAIQAVEHGLQALQVDEGPLSRTWMARQVPRWFGERLPADDENDAIRERYEEARPGLSSARELGVDVRTRCSCWGMFENGIAGLYDGERAWFVQADNVILATGSHEHPLAFTGRSLPGVMGGLGALDLLQTYGTLGGERVVVLGSDNFGLEVARRCIQAGHEVASIVEIGPEPRGDRTLIRELEQAGAEIIPGYTAVYASGNEHVEQIMLGGVDEQGQRLPGESFPIRADTLCVALGRAPMIDLAYLAGCEFQYDSRLGGYYPRHSETMATSVDGVFVAGDAAGASDASFTTPEVAEAQGRIAAMSVAARQGRLSRDEADEQRSPLIQSVQQIETSPHDDGIELWQRALMHVAPDDVVICRCEGVTRASLMREFDIVGDRIPDELKRVSRAGMGECQGRGCRTVIAHLLAFRQGIEPGEVPMASYRPPVRPVPLGALASIDPPSFSLHPAFAELERQIETDIAAGTVPADRLAAARYKIREENHLAQGLSEDEIARRVHELAVTIRTVRVH